MTKLELSYLAEDMEEDAMDYADFEMDELLAQIDEKYKEKYFDFYDDIKLTPYDDW